MDAKSVSTAIADITATSPEAGTVDIRVLLQDGELPTQTILEEIEEALNASDVRPLTDVVKVSMPEETTVEIDLTYYISRNSQASTSVIDRAAKAAVEEYAQWQTGKMGRDVNPSYLTQLLMAAGVKRVEVRKPTFQTIERTHVARIARDEMIVLNGGMEDD